MKLEGGAGAQIGGSPGAVSPVMPGSWVVLPMTRISPLELMACASMNTAPKSAELALFRSIIPVCLVHTKARSPEELVEVPTISPESLIPRAWLECPPGKTPIPCIPLSLVHKNARIPPGPLEYPTTSPALLIAAASLAQSPGKVPRSIAVPVLVHTTARSPVELAEVPATSSKSFKLHALL